MSNYFHSKKSKNNSLIVITLIFICLLIFFYVFGFINGGNISYMIERSISWIVDYFLFSVFFILIPIIKPQNRGLRYLSFINFFSDIFIILLNSVLFKSNFIAWYILIEIPQIGFLIIIFNWLRKSNTIVDNTTVAVPNELEIINEPEQQENKKTHEGTNNDSPISSHRYAVVINSINERATSASKTMLISLISMIVIVLVGGGFSIGSEALNELGSVRELRIQRDKLEDLSNKISDKDSIKLIQKNVSQYFGKDYINALQKIQDASVISWQDIAMKITIAVLTLFLVQVFFSIYKYNQQQSSYLFSKSEIIEIFKDEKDAKDDKLLKKGLFLKMETPPKFDKGPSSPTDKVVSVFENVIKKK